jgi:hypothetical protein
MCLPLLLVPLAAGCEVDRQPVDQDPGSFAGGPGAPIRVATFNVAFNREAEGDLIADLADSNHEQAAAVAEIIQRVRPDILLLNEFDYDPNEIALSSFQALYLSVSQNGQRPIEYAFRYSAPSNTGEPSGFDLDNNGSLGDPEDAFGFGRFPGQYGMAMLSVFSIVRDSIRTFQHFLWKDMPRAMIPDDPRTARDADWYSADELAVLRLSSKSHWDVPIRVGDRTLHLLASHPTPPSFDNPPRFPDGVDFNGRRNHDEIRFWADYVDPTSSPYIYDDEGRQGGLQPDALFVIAGDLNADPQDGAATESAVLQLLRHPLVNTEPVPASEGGFEQARQQAQANAEHRGDPGHDTADFSDPEVGNLRVDYVLPRVTLGVVDSGVFWPRAEDPLFRLVGTDPPASSDHRLVWIDVVLPPVLTDSPPGP